MSDFDDNVIEFFSNSKTASVTFSQKKWINKIKKYAEKHSDVEIIAENDDGSIFAHIPIKWVKISPPRQREMTDEERAKAAERLKKARDSKNANSV